MDEVLVYLLGSCQELFMVEGQLYYQYYKTIVTLVWSQCRYMLYRCTLQSLAG